MSAGARAADDPSWRDEDGPHHGRVSRGADRIDAALRSRLGKRGQVLRRSATRLVVRFEGETTLARIRPQLLRVVSDGTRGPDPRTVRRSPSVNSSRN